MSNENLWTSFERSRLHGLWKNTNITTFCQERPHNQTDEQILINDHICTPNMYIGAHPNRTMFHFSFSLKGLFLDQWIHIHCKISPKAKLEYSIEWKEKTFCFHNGTVNRFRDFGSFTFWSIYLYPTGWKICCLFFKQKTETAEFEIVRERKDEFLNKQIGK